MNDIQTLLLNAKTYLADPSRWAEGVWMMIDEQTDEITACCAEGALELQRNNLATFMAHSLLFIGYEFEMAREALRTTVSDAAPWNNPQYNDYLHGQGDHAELMRWFDRAYIKAGEI